MYAGNSTKPPQKGTGEKSTSIDAAVNPLARPRPRPRPRLHHLHHHGQSQRPRQLQL